MTDDREKTGNKNEGYKRTPGIHFHLDIFVFAVAKGFLLLNLHPMPPWIKSIHLFCRQKVTIFRAKNVKIGQKNVESCALTQKVLD